MLTNNICIYLLKYYVIMAAKNRIIMCSARIRCKLENRSTYSWTRKVEPKEIICGWWTVSLKIQALRFFVFSRGRKRNFHCVCFTAGIHSRACPLTLSENLTPHELKFLSKRWEWLREVLLSSSILHKEHVNFSTREICTGWKTLLSCVQENAMVSADRPVFIVPLCVFSASF